MEPKDICILAIETSCDETAAAVIKNGREILSNVIYSQIDLHTEYGGVVPEIASRAHIEKINPVVRKALRDAGMSGEDVDAVAVTCGPGLVGPLLVGVSEAKALAYGFGKPLIGVHHIKGHIAANYLAHPEFTPPFLCLVVSGGHTHLVMVEDYDKFDVLGRTVDDAAGEAFDKVARAVGLGYPGGPKIDKAAREGDPEAYHFPKAKVNKEEYSFSFSGLKSCVLNMLNSAKMSGEEIRVPDLAASFQKAVVDVLCDHFLEALAAAGAKSAALAGGVASNSALREEMRRRCAEIGVPLYVPPPILCTDNAAMIGAAAYPEFLAGRFADLSLNADPRLML